MWGGSKFSCFCPIKVAVTTEVEIKMHSQSTQFPKSKKGEVDGSVVGMSTTQ
jgi:hypothetical protein